MKIDAVDVGALLLSSVLFTMGFCGVVSATMRQAGATGPLVVWIHDGVAVDHFEVCVDAACADVGGSPNAGTQGAGTFAWRLAAPLAPQAHAIVVKACSVAGCVESDPFTIALPAKPTIKALR